MIRVDLRTLASVIFQFSTHTGCQSSTICVVDLPRHFMTKCSLHYDPMSHTNCHHLHLLFPHLLLPPATPALHPVLSSSAFIPAIDPSILTLSVPHNGLGRHLLT